MIGKNGIPRIGVVPSHGYDTDKPFVKDTYIKALEAAGCEPVPIDVHSPMYLMLALISSFDGVLFTGGSDVNPSHYGQVAAPQCDKPDHLRDQVELALADLAIARCVPMLGICRGAQLINVAMRGTLIQDIPTRFDGAQHYMTDEDRSHVWHDVRIAPDSRLGRALGMESIGVNSTHHQCVDELAEGLSACAWAPEGFVEAYESTGPHFILGVQWHPEVMAPVDENARKIFKMLHDAVH